MNSAGSTPEVLVYVLLLLSHTGRSQDFPPRCQPVLEYYDRAVDMCRSCEDVCDRGEMALDQCMRRCKDYYYQKIVPHSTSRPQLKQGNGYQQDEPSPSSTKQSLVLHSQFLPATQLNQEAADGQRLSHPVVAVIACSVGGAVVVSVAVVCLRRRSAHQRSRLHKQKSKRNIFIEEAVQHTEEKGGPGTTSGCKQLITESQEFIELKEVVAAHHKVDHDSTSLQSEPPPSSVSLQSPVQPDPNAVLTTANIEHPSASMHATSNYLSFEIVRNNSSVPDIAPGIDVSLRDSMNDLNSWGSRDGNIASLQHVSDTSGSEQSVDLAAYKMESEDLESRNVGISFRTGRGSSSTDVDSTQLKCGTSYHEPLSVERHSYTGQINISHDDASCCVDQDDETHIKNVDQDVTHCKTCEADHNITSFRSLHHSDHPTTLANQKVGLSEGSHHDTQHLHNGVIGSFNRTEVDSPEVHSRQGLQNSLLEIALDRRLVITSSSLTYQEDNKEATTKACHSLPSEMNCDEDVVSRLLNAAPDTAETQHPSHRIQPSSGYKTLTTNSHASNADGDILKLRCSSTEDTEYTPMLSQDKDKACHDVVDSSNTCVLGVESPATSLLTGDYSDEEVIIENYEDN